MIYFNLILGSKVIINRKSIRNKAKKRSDQSQEKRELNRREVKGERIMSFIQRHRDL